MVITWEKSDDWDFVSYELLYSGSQYGPQNSLLIITDKNITNYLTTDFNPLQENWYQIKVTDFWGLSSTGNEMTHDIDEPPTVVNIISITGISSRPICCSKVWRTCSEHTKYQNNN